MINPDNNLALFKVENSPIAGMGCFALASIAKGETVYRMTGEPADFETLLALVLQGKEAPSDPLQIDIGSYLDLEEVSRSFNHSCNPNLFLRGTTELVALRDINVGEEMTYDYSTTMHYDLEQLQANKQESWTCTCCCGADNCRGIIDEFKSLPEARKTYYLENSFVPDYILRLFA
ncbi:MAG: SET domain-containing protein [Cytophagales bacterium]|nr:MAG: SET domain-containing protein [Cytophagales bacterium]TAF61924.1 MAG: SET domain-containing protein [Cytophagales bacterium]